MREPTAGPLAGLRVLEFAGIGPAPFCGMLLSDLGADVLRIDRPGASYDRYSVETRGRRSLVLDLKSSEGRQTALALGARASVLIEGFRPGVMERLGLAPEVLHGLNARLVYARMTGWGQSGPAAQRAGHDINFIALTGALHAIGPPQAPAVPLNLVGDFGGGALYLAFGILAALRHAEQTGVGQVIDCAMSDGAIGLMALLYGHFARGSWKDARGSNIIDGGAHFYNVYRCADDQWIAVGAIEPPFYAELVRRAGLDPALFSGRQDAQHWPDLRERLAAVFAQRTREQWCALLEDTDCCVTPVLSMGEAPQHPHNRARGAFTEVDGVVQPAPSPRFSRTPGAIRHGPVAAGEGGEAALREWGVTR